MEEVILYTTGCPKCAVLKKKLETAGIAYTVCDDITEMRRRGLLSAPALNIGGRILAFSEAIEWLRGREA